MASRPDRNYSDSCLFCKIINGKIPSAKVYEDEDIFAFLDINPLSKGHTLVIPKHHAMKLHELPEMYAAALGAGAHKIATAIGCTDYNILQNNGRIAHQAVDHVHFHIIPRTATSGLEIGWKSTNPSKEELAKNCEDIRNKL